VFTRLRWLSIVVPVLLVGVIETLSDSLLDPWLPFPFDTITVTLVVLGCAATLSWLAFREIDDLTGDLQTRNVELARRTATARGLTDVAVDVAAGGDLEATLRSVVRQAKVLLAADVAVLQVDSQGIAPLVLRDPEPVAKLSGTSVEEELDAATVGGRLVGPIRMGGEVVGELGVGVLGRGRFGVDDVETLTGLASMAAVAVRNHHLRATLRALAARGERERIAREMHDGLAQVLAYASAKSAAADQLLEAGNVAGARDQMAELGRVARSTYVDVRESIVGLAQPVVAGHGLASAIEAYGTQFAETSKLAVEVTASPEARLSTLAPDAEAHAFRIVQEALTNIRKHARAARVRITMAIADDGCLEIAVEDNGRGLPADLGGSRDWPHFGLATMAARAAEAGGTVTWAARDEGGTRVIIRLPVVRGRTASPGSTVGPGASAVTAATAATAASAATAAEAPAATAPAPVGSR